MTHDVVALRGVCVAPGKHLQPGERATLDAATFRFLRSIGAVQEAPAEAPDPQPVAPAKSARREN